MLLVCFCTVLYSAAVEVKEQADLGPDPEFAAGGASGTTSKQWHAGPAATHMNMNNCMHTMLPQPLGPRDVQLTARDEQLPACAALLSNHPLTAPKQYICTAQASIVQPSAADDNTGSSCNPTSMHQLQRTTLSTCASPQACILPAPSVHHPLDGGPPAPAAAASSWVASFLKYWHLQQRAPPPGRGGGMTWCSTAQHGMARSAQHTQHGSAWQCAHATRHSRAISGI